MNRHLAKKAEHDNPPAGKFLDVDGVRLHYVERGSGEPLVLFHGNGSMIQDFESSGLVDLTAKNYRVIIIDRPGFGHSSAGQDDRLIDIDRQSARLHSDVSQSAFHRVAQNGHMIHQTATGEVMAAINEVAGKGPRPQSIHQVFS